MVFEIGVETGEAGYYPGENGLRRSSLWLVCRGGCGGEVERGSGSLIRGRDATEGLIREVGGDGEPSAEGAVVCYVHCVVVEQVLVQVHAK